MNHPSQFVRPLPGARAIGRRAAPSSCSSAALNHAQMAVHSLGVGRSGFGSCVLPPARVNLFRAQGILPERLGRRRIAGGPFGRLSGCVNTRLAKPINHTLRGCTLHRFAKGSERHFIVSSLDSHDANEIGLTDAQILFAPGAKTHD